MAGEKILQFCHGYEGPFLDVCRQYLSLFEGTSYAVTTVFLTGPENKEVMDQLSPNEVIFLGYQSEQVRNLKINAIRDIRRISLAKGFTLIIAHRFKPIYIACLATKLPVIGVHHAFGDYHRPLRRIFANLFKKRLILLGVSQSVRNDIAKSLPNWPLWKIDTLYNRIDAGKLRSKILPCEDARMSLGLPKDAYVVANVGRLHPDKDQMTLLRGFAKALSDLPANSLLVILGQGRLEKELRSMAEELGIAGNARFLGQVPQAFKYFRAFDLFVLSSDYEPFGMVLLEAMAAGVPVIATNCGGAPEVVGNLGKLFRYRDDSELAQILVEESSMTVEERKSYEIKAIKRLEEFFSFKAGKEIFWNLPAVKKVLEQPKIG